MITITRKKPKDCGILVDEIGRPEKRERKKKENKKVIVTPLQ